MGLFDKLDLIVDGWLGIDDTWKGSAPRYANKSSLDRLCTKDLPIGEGKSLVQDLYQQLESNWDNQPTSGKMNWFHRQALDLSEKATSPEVTLNRTFMQVVSDANWANEVPVASGVADTSSDSVDFVLKSDDQYWMIELKWPRPKDSQNATPSQKPLGAAVQVLRYGLAYVFSRANAGKLGYNPTGQPILIASQVHLRVLGPEHFYSPFVSKSRWLQKLEKEFDEGIADLASRNGLEMSFAFEQFARGFAWDPADRYEEKNRRAVEKAFQDRHRLFGECRQS